MSDMSDRYDQCRKCANYYANCDDEALEGMCPAQECTMEALYRDTHKPCVFFCQVEEQAPKHTTGHWHCGEPMEIVDTTPDGYDVFGCTLCDHRE